MKTKTCDGCIHHSYRCGFGNSIAKMMGVTNPVPVWICKKLDMEWPRDCSHPDRKAQRRKECIEGNLFTKEANNER